MLLAWDHAVATEANGAAGLVTQAWPFAGCRRGCRLSPSSVPLPLDHSPATALLPTSEPHLPHASRCGLASVPPVSSSPAPGPLIRQPAMSLGQWLAPFGWPRSTAISTRIHDLDKGRHILSDPCPNCHTRRHQAHTLDWLPLPTIWFKSQTGFSIWEPHTNPTHTCHQVVSDM